MSSSADKTVGRFLSKLGFTSKAKPRESRPHTNLQLRACADTIREELRSDHTVLAMGLHCVADVDIISSGGFGSDSWFLRRFAQACLSLRSEIAAGTVPVTLALECVAPLTALVGFVVSKTPKLGSTLEEDDWAELQGRLGLRPEAAKSASRMHFYLQCRQDPTLIDCDSEAIACICATLMSARSISIVPMSRLLLSDGPIHIVRGALDVRLFGCVQQLSLSECIVETVVGECDPIELTLAQSTLLTPQVDSSSGSLPLRSSSWVKVGGSLKALVVEDGTVNSEELGSINQTLSSLTLVNCKIAGPDNVFTLSKVYSDTSHSSWFRLTSISAVKCGVRALHPSVQLAVSLVRLDLSSNCIEDIHPELSHCTALKEVFLCRNRLYDVTDISTALSNVTILDLSHNEIVSVWALAKLEHLQSLDISSNRLRFWSDLDLLSRRCLNIRRINFRENPLCSPQQIFANDVNKLGIALFQKPSRFAPSAASMMAVSSTRLVESPTSPSRRSTTSELFGAYRSNVPFHPSLVSVNGVVREMSAKEAEMLLSKYEGLLAVHDSVLTSLDVLENVRVEKREAKLLTTEFSAHPLTSSPTEITQFSESEPKFNSESPIHVSHALFPDTRGDSCQRSVSRSGDTVVTTLISTRVEGGAGADNQNDDSSRSGAKKVTVVRRIVKKRMKKVSRPVVVNALPTDYLEVPGSLAGSSKGSSQPPSVLSSTTPVIDGFVDPLTGDRADMTWLVTKYGPAQGFQRYAELTDGLIDRGPLNSLLEGAPQVAATPPQAQQDASLSSDGFNDGIAVAMSDDRNEGSDEDGGWLVSEPPSVLGRALGAFLEGQLVPTLREASAHHESSGVRMTVFAVEGITASPILGGTAAVATELEANGFFATGASFSAMAGVSDDLSRERQLSFAEKNPLSLYRGGNIWEAEMRGRPGRSDPREVWLLSPETANSRFTPSKDPVTPSTAAGQAPLPLGHSAPPCEIDAASEAAMLDAQLPPQYPIREALPPKAPLTHVKLSRSSSRYVGMVLVRVDRFESDYHVGFALRSKTVTEDTLVSSFQRPVLTSVHYCPWARGQSEVVVRTTNVRVVTPNANAGTGSLRKAARSTLEAAFSGSESSRPSAQNDTSSAPFVWGEVGDPAGSSSRGPPQALMTEAQVAESSAAHSTPTPSTMVVGFVVEPHLVKAVIKCLIKKLHAYRDPTYVSQRLDWPLFVQGADESNIQLPRYSGCIRNDDPSDGIVAAGLAFRGVVREDDEIQEDLNVREEAGVEDLPEVAPLGIGVGAASSDTRRVHLHEDPWCLAQYHSKRLRRTQEGGGFDVDDPPSTRLSFPIVLSPRRLVCGLLRLMCTMTAKPLAEFVGVTRPGVEFRVQPDEIGLHVRAVLMPQGGSTRHVDPASPRAPHSHQSSAPTLTTQLRFAFCNATVASSNSIDGIRDDVEFAAFIVVLKDTFCVFHDMNYRGSHVKSVDDLFEPILTYSIADLEFVGIGYGYGHLVLNFGAGTSEIFLFFREVSSLAQVLSYIREVCFTTTIFSFLPLPDPCYRQVSSMTGCSWERSNSRAARPPLDLPPRDSLEVVGYSSCFIAQLAYSLDPAGLQVIAVPSPRLGTPDVSASSPRGDVPKADASATPLQKLIVTRAELDSSLKQRKEPSTASQHAPTQASKYQPRASTLGKLQEDASVDDLFGGEGGGLAGTLRNFFSVSQFNASVSKRTVGLDTPITAEITSSFPLRHFPKLSATIAPSGWERCSVIFSKPRFHVSVLQEDYLSWLSHLRGEGGDDSSYASPITSFAVEDIHKVEVSPRLASLPLLVVLHVAIRGHSSSDGMGDRFLLCFQHLRQVDQFLFDLEAFHKASCDFRELEQLKLQEKTAEEAAAAAAAFPRVRKQLVSAASVLFDEGRVLEKEEKQTSGHQRKLVVVQLEAHPSTDMGSVGPCELLLSALGKRAPS